MKNVFYKRKNIKITIAFIFPSSKNLNLPFTCKLYMIDASYLMTFRVNVKVNNLSNSRSDSSSFSLSWLFLVGLVSFLCGTVLNKDILYFSCFERFFKHVNQKENKIIAKRRGGHLMDDLELIGMDYLWRVSSLKKNLTIF